MSQSLKKYKAKRRFTRTPEPSGRKKTSKGDLVFVIQKHHASRLHYDLRLELDGVLKSWAVPKGPSMNPADKRLAMMVEDHPFDYRHFEGVIPKANYGAGSVMIWDEGTYTVPGSKNRKEAEKLVREGLKQGHFHILFQGQKLHGEFILVHIPSREPNAWLLMKKKDAFSSTKDITKQELSVTTQRTMAQIASNAEPGDAFHALLKEAPKAKMPSRIKPMLSVLVEEPFDKEGWIFEIKWDGYRAISYLNKKQIHITSRNNLSFDERFAPIVRDLKKLKVDSAILDGEVVVLDEKGIPSFQLMQNYMRTQQGRLVYYVFDLLHLNGRDLKELPLIDRKAVLKSILQPKSTIVYSDHVEEKGKRFFRAAAKKNLEGIMAKDATSPYREKRTREWQKIKTHLGQEVLIGGFTEPQGGRKYFGALLVGVYKGKTLTYAGKVGTGFTEQTLQELYKKMETLIQTKSPFKNEPKMKNVIFIKPKLVCEVSFAEWTSDGSMRHPVFKGLRIDKKPKEIKME